MIENCVFKWNHCQKSNCDTIYNGKLLCKFVCKTWLNSIFCVLSNRSISKGTTKNKKQNRNIVQPNKTGLIYYFILVGLWSLVV